VTGATVVGATITIRRVMRRIINGCREERWDALTVGSSGIGDAPNTPMPVRNVAAPVIQASALTLARLHRFGRGARSLILRPTPVPVALILVALILVALGL